MSILTDNTVSFCHVNGLSNTKMKPYLTSLLSTYLNVSTGWRLVEVQAFLFKITVVPTMKDE